jgi:tetratricopeptide (TPR) repeat protein
MTETPPIQRIFAELKRRKVFRIAALYGAGAFAVLQAVDIMAEGLALPAAVLTVVTVAVLVGFPMALIVAWVYERRPEGGLKRTEQALSEEIQEIVAQPRSRRWTSGLLALAGTALLVFGTWLVAGRLNSVDPTLPTDGAATATAGTGVLIMPFAVQGSPDVEYLGQGLVSLLGTSFDGAGDLRSVDARAVIQFTEREGLVAGDREAGAAAAEIFGARLYVVGDIVEAGGRMRVTAALYDAARDGRPMGQSSVEGAEDEMFEMVDDLTAQLLSGLSDGAAARVRRIAAVTTESLPALKAFLEGEEEFRRGQFRPAVESFRRAVSEDSTFALAYYRLSLVAEWNLEDRLSREMAEKAVRYADRLAERDRRLLEAFLIRRRGDNLMAAQAYRSILGAYPDEMEAWLDLAEVQFHSYPLYGRSFTDASESLERVLELDPDHSTALIHLARLRAYEGDIEGLEDIAERFVALSPDPARTLEVQALRAYGTGDEVRIEEVEAALPQANEVAVSLAVWAASVYCRDAQAGERVASTLVHPNRSPEARRLGQAWLANFAAARGNWAEAQARLAVLEGWSAETALEYEAILATMPFSPTTESEFRELAARLEGLDPVTVPTSANPSIIFTSHDEVHPVIRAYQLGLIRARLGEADAALALAVEIESMTLLPTAGSLTSDLAHGIRASVLRQQGRLEDALAELEKARIDAWYGQTMASPLFARIYERFLGAELLFELGRYDEAESWYATIGQLSPFEQPYLAPAHLRLAVIADRRGDSDAAAAHRAAYEDLWFNADSLARAALNP